MSSPYRTPVRKSSRRGRAPCARRPCPLERHVVRQHAHRIARVERVHEAHVLRAPPLHSRDGRTEGPADVRDYLRASASATMTARPSDFIRRVVELRVEGDRQVRRNRPGRGRPDQDRDAATGQLRVRARRARRAVRRQRELHVDRRRGVVRVLDFSFRERGPAVDAPVDRLLALVDEPALDELAQRARDRRLVIEVHRQVGVLPVAEDARAAGTPRSSRR